MACQWTRRLVATTSTFLRAPGVFKSGSSVTAAPLKFSKNYSSVPGNSPSSRASWEENRRARVQLAASYRILERMGLHEGICNHLSMMTKASDGSGDEVMLLVPYGLHWREVTASSLLGISAAGEVVEGEGNAETSAFCIHRGVRHLKNHPCVFHVHPPYTTAIACLKDPTILPCHQAAIRFYQKIAYDTEFGGYGDNMVEGRRLGDKLGTDKDLLVMGSHGVLCVGDSPGWALDSIYYIERLAMTQVLAMSTGRELSLVSEDLMIKCQPYLSDMPKMVEQHFDAQVRMLQKDCPDFTQ